MNWPWLVLVLFAFVVIGAALTIETVNPIWWFLPVILICLGRLAYLIYILSDDR